MIDTPLRLEGSINFCENIRSKSSHMKLQLPASTMSRKSARTQGDFQILAPRFSLQPRQGTSPEHWNIISVNNLESLSIQSMAYRLLHHLTTNAYTFILADYGSLGGFGFGERSCSAALSCSLRRRVWCTFSIFMDHGQRSLSSRGTCLSIDSGVPRSWPEGDRTRR